MAPTDSRNDCRRHFGAYGDRPQRTGSRCLRRCAGGWDGLPISAGTVAEAFIVSGRRNVAEEMERLIEGIGFEVVAVTMASARRIALAYHRWGKGVHPAALNFGDCFAYEVAKTRGCRVLYVGEDFVRTDVDSAI